jgi:sugar (pentulose or hexulose) kinase
VLGLAVTLPEVTESAAAGAAALAGLAVGARPGVANMAGLTSQPARMVEPASAERLAYDDLYGQWLHSTETAAS